MSPQPMDANTAEEVSAVGLVCSDPVISRLLAFFDREDVQRTHTQFSRAHVDAFLGFHASQDDEIPHAVHDLFLNYERLFEQTIQSFLEAEQIEPEAFYKHCQRLHRHVERESKTDGDDGTDDENALLNLQVVLAALDFKKFCELMEREALETQRALKQAEDMGL